ncbi:MAG: VWA domain-containing protein [Acidobacteria bacterium]|nr:VWA domain-containing protein [Acidobacteriota bacterium]
MIRLWCLSAALLSLVVGVSAQTKPAPAKADDNVIRLTTDLVVVDTQVVGQAHGKIIGGLKADDFIVEEEGVKQEISFFTQDKLPLSVVLLFDLTDTVQPVLKELAKGALTALQHFKPEDELAVAVYSNKVQVLQPFTRERAPIVAAIEQAAKLDAREQLALFNEALFQTAGLIETSVAPRTRRVILWLTDNLPNRPPKSAHTEDEAFAQLFEHDIAVFGLMMQSAEGKVLGFVNIFMRGAGDLNKYAERTGGEVIKVEKENVEQRLAEVIDRVRARYTLGYISTNASQQAGFRRLRVRVTNAVERREGKVVLRGKAGYFAKKSPTK